MDTPVNKTMLLISGILFTIAIFLDRLYEVVILRPMYGDTSLLGYSLAMFVLYLPILLYCFFLHRFKKGHIAYLITLVFHLILLGSSAVGLLIDQLGYMGNMAYFSAYFNFVPLISKLLMVIETFAKQRVITIIIGIFSIFGLLVSFVDIWTTAFSLLLGGTYVTYLISLTADFFMELAFLLFWLGVFVKKKIL